MPVTPFHFGPGMLAKSLAPARVSLAMFVLAQVVIDVESAYYRFVVQEWPVHRWAHTFIGATLVGLLVGAAGFAAARYIGSPRSTDLGFRQCIVGGFVGGISHPFLDGIMHSDIQPLMPLSPGNPFLHLVSLGALHLLCVAAGLCGVIVWMLRRGGVHE